MAITRTLLVFFLLLTLLSGAVLVLELWHMYQTRQYNVVIEQTNFAAAEPYLGDHGLYAKAYAEQQSGHFHEALIIYTSLRNTEDKSLRSDTLFNTANTYLQQALQLDLKKQADQALPLIELAKTTYRELLSIDSQYWDAKYNLERALKLLPDSADQVFIVRTSSRELIKKEISADTKDGLP